MGSKNISITEEVYNLLKKLKLEGESFSDTIRRLAKSKGQISEFAGLWSDMSDEKLQDIIQEIELFRKRIDNELLGK
ncbi:MAG: antitoxin VapB family protein [Candidatus Helarchaeota archaeon]